MFAGFIRLFECFSLESAVQITFNHFTIHEHARNTSTYFENILNAKERIHSCFDNRDVKTEKKAIYFIIRILKIDFSEAIIQFFVS